MSASKEVSKTPDSRETKPEKHSRKKTFLHPASGATVLALDWLFFSGNALSLGLSTPWIATLGFVLGTLIVTGIQHRYGADSTGRSWLKGVLGGVAVGIPFPIAGTAVGAWVLSLSGLNWLQRGRSKKELSSGDAAD